MGNEETDTKAEAADWIEEVGLRAVRDLDTAHASVESHELVTARPDVAGEVIFELLQRIGIADD